MNIPAEFRREEDGRWVAEIPEFPGARAYGSTRHEAASGAMVRAFRILADRIESGELKVEDEPEAIILGGTANSLSELLIEIEGGPTLVAEAVATTEKRERDGGEGVSAVQERVTESRRAEESDSFAAAQFRAPGTLADYYRLRETLEDLILKVADDESHPMAALVDRIGTMVEQYESTHLPEILESKLNR
jgi:predicted RNase H-like HicB family nuclease